MGSSSPTPPSDLFSAPERDAKEALLGQAGRVIWLYGRSGSGKSTLSSRLCRDLHEQGRFCVLLDGDALRAGLNQGLGFTAADRSENLRRAAEVARLMAQSGIIVIAAFITPQNTMRKMIREIIGPADLLEVHLKCDYATCSHRDVKGLYARARAGELAHFTGPDIEFEPPQPPAWLEIDTRSQSIEICAEKLLEAVAEKLARTP